MTRHVSDFDFIDFQKALKAHWETQGFKVLVCGKTGVGKSSLVNVLVGQEVCEVGGPGESQLDFEEAFSAQTSQVDGVCIRIQDILLTIFDSPGLQDGTENEAAYLEDMHKKCSDANLVLYCIDMTTPRWLSPEVKATQLLTEKFGLDFWKKTVVVLTKGNMIRPRDDRDEVKHCKKVYEMFVQKFQAQLKAQGVPEDVAHAIPAVAAGSESDRVIPYVSSEVKSNDPEDFLPELWITCMESISGNSRENFVKVTRPDRFKFKDKGRMTAEQRELIERLKRNVEDCERRQQQQEEFFQKKIELMEEKQRKVIEEMHYEYLKKYTLELAHVRGPPAEFTNEQVNRFSNALPPPPSYNDAVYGSARSSENSGSGGNVADIGTSALAGAQAGVLIGSIGGPVCAAIGGGVGALIGGFAVMLKSLCS